MSVDSLRNQRLSEKRSFADYYSRYLGGRISSPEQAILSMVRNRFSDIRMLDIGVGTGRTTSHFGPFTREYVGLDYSAVMVAQCQSTFRDSLPGARFMVLDARNMHVLSDSCFNLVLFSFNGIDFVSYDERMIVLREMRRVCTPDGICAFSSHTLRNNPLFVVHKPTPAALLRLLAVSLLNRGLSRKRLGRHAYIRGCGHMFRLGAVFIDPEAQVEDLLSLGFRRPQVLSLTDGRVVPPDMLTGISDNFVYYVCEK